MPGTNLTREEATTRAALIDVTSYTVDLDLTEARRERTDLRLHHHDRVHLRRAGSRDLGRPGRRDVHEIILNGSRSTPRRTSTAGSR